MDKVSQTPTLSCRLMHERMHKEEGKKKRKSLGKEAVTHLSLSLKKVWASGLCLKAVSITLIIPYLENKYHQHFKHIYQHTH